MSEFFFEIRSGEIPGPMQRAAAKDLERILSQKLKDLSLEFNTLKAFVGPRRLGVVVGGVSSEIPALHTEKRGPRVDAPQKAIDGFLTSSGVKLEELESRKTPKGTFYFLTTITAKQSTEDVLPGIIQDIIYGFPWPKSMTWSTTTRSWIRPIHGGCALFDGKKMDFDVSMNEENHPDPILISFSDVTVGHCFMAPSPFQVKSFEDYQQKLNKAFVIVDQDQRKKIIDDQLQAICKKKNLSILPDQGLMDEVTGLVEWPVCLLGTIQSEFMSLPPELLKTTMRVHQRYFSAHKDDGSFAPHFILVANIEAPDEGKQIIIGNERVLKARLSDAAFFYDQDRKKSLISHGTRLEKTVFHADLGNMAQKQNRLSTIINFFNESDKVSVKHARQAATLCKADLMGEMVYEFPELQGIIGSYYAKADGYHQDVANAIYNQYSPKGPSDDLPSVKAAQLLALADRFDTLVGFFSIGIKPTGSKDPFALRRSTLGIIRYLEEDFDVFIPDVLSQVFDLFEEVKNLKKEVKKETVLKDLELFLMERLKVYWRDQGYGHGYVNAVLGEGLSAPLFVLKERLIALVDFVEKDPQNAQNLFSGYKRAVNILKKEKVISVDLPQEALFEKDEERLLFNELLKADTALKLSLSKADYKKALLDIAPLNAPIDGFFDHVQVNDSRNEIRDNRLKILRYLQRIFETYADFSQV